MNKKHINTIIDNMKHDMEMSSYGCGECQSSCQSACKTSCTVGNQHCENLSRDSQVQL